MNSLITLRPGGRSARVQAAVHSAVHALLEEVERGNLTVPMIAQHAGVTPSTIYRRWGNLADLLSDVAMDRMRADTAPVDTGSVLGDLQAWAEQYLDEMSSEVGLTMLHDILAGNQRSGIRGLCAGLVASQVQEIIDRRCHGKLVAPAVDVFIDTVVAPIIYRALFGPAPLTRAKVRALVAQCAGLA